MNIEFDGQIITCNVQYSHRTKISLHMEGQRLVTIRVPNKTSEETITRAIKQYGKWILENSLLYEKAQQQPQAREYEHKGTFLHLGKEFALYELIEIGQLSEEELKHNLKRFYFKSCKQIVNERIKGF